jgi:small conductance mechanosensitive channel
MNMFNRFVFCAALALAGVAAAQPATQPATQPILKLQATAASSEEVDLKWFDKLNTYSRYIIYRSDDHGKTFHAIGHENGGANTGPGYQHADVKVTESTEYEYRLESLEDAVISNVVDVSTPHSNLIEAANGEAKLRLTDVTSVEFWAATFGAALKWVVNFIPTLLVALIIFFIFWIFYRMARHLTLRSIKRSGLDPTVHDLLLAAIKYSILGYGLIIALDQLGVHVTALLTGISIMGLAIGFAAQDTIANLIASVVIFWDKPFKVGDWVTLDGQYGRVERVTFRSTRMLKENGDTISSPNTVVLSSKLINHSINPINWVSVPLGIPDTLSIEKVRAALLATTEGDDRLQATPPPKVVVDSINPGAVNIFLCFCIKDEGMQSELLQVYLEKAKNALDKLRA